MTAAESTTRVVSDSGNDVGPGQRLREARQAAKLTLNEVASRMRLEPHVLEFLENDQYDRLHGPTFVRGYLSGYARLLDLPERPILEAYERHDYRPPALVSELGRKPEVHVSDFPVRMVTYVIAGLLVVLVVLWWQSRQPHPGTPERADATPSSKPPAESTARTEPAVTAAADTDARPMLNATPALPVVTTAQSTESTAASDSEAAASQSQLAAPASVSAGETPPAEAASSAAAGPVSDLPLGGSQATASESSENTASDATPPASDDGTAVALAPGGEAADADAMAPASAAGSADADVAAASGEQQTEQAPRPAPLPGSDRLAIRFARESWVEIYDRGGGRLYYSLASQGSEVVVEGAGPMRVLLGDIEGAAVAYNGEPFDLSRYQGRSVVRFTIGELSSTTAPESPAPAPTEEPLTRASPAPSTASGRKQSVADAAGALENPPAPAAETGPSRTPPGTPPAIANELPASPSAGIRPDS